MQGELERALGVVLRREEVALTVAGRTDAGVHALHQVASYGAPPAGVRALNALLPDDVAVLACAEAPTGFDARRSATSRAYLYRVLARPARSALLHGRAWHWPRALDLDALAACAKALAGTHDFTAFTPTETYHVRFTREVFHASWRASPRVAGLLEFSIEADTFMRSMNRVLVGTMVQVAAGRRGVADFVRLLSGAPRTAAGPTAPACGLYLAGVGYGGERVIGDRRTDAALLPPAPPCPALGSGRCGCS